MTDQLNYGAHSSPDFNDFPIVLWKTDCSGFRLQFNRAWYSYVGAQLEQENWLESLDPTDRDKFKESINIACSKSTDLSLDISVRNKAGVYIPHRVLAKADFDDFGNFSGLVGSMVELHNSELTASPLENSYFKIYTEAMPQMAFIADSAGNIVYFNRRWYDYIQGSAETEGWGWANAQIHHPDDLEKTLRRWRYSLNTGTPYEIEYRLRRYDGVYRWHLGKALPVKDANGNIELWLGTNTDVHRQKEAEQALKEANDLLLEKNNQLNKINKLHKDLLYLISHDLRNPISSIFFMLNIIKTSPCPDEIQSMLNAIEEAVKRQEKLLSGIGETIEVQAVKEVKHGISRFENLLDDAKDDLMSLLKESKGTITTDFGEVAEVDYVPGFIRSVFYNLLTNAIKYAKPHVPPHVHISSQKQQDYIVLKFRDNGIGLDLKKVGADLFNPFTRFSDLAEGKGIGLYIIKSLVEKNGGYIEVESTQDEGTTFSVYLKEYA